ncbi:MULTISPECIES: helix-turn-helix transcriptional regulator [unclassified Novosphingobium]|uniref:helix-turn-helix domain-containing protein n=1 Tax=unclassified Novosphingobium TaxID=2644732 RepID=UPI00146C42C4|nr:MULTISPECIES: helix-turn-helix transcriptional regulator [unclassified Novosphingobium]
MKLRGIVAGNLRRLRMAKGLSQEEVAHLAGLDRNYVGNLEREQNSPTVDTLERIAAVLDAPALEFFRQPD